MVRTGEYGVRLAQAVFVISVVFTGCGGDSKSSRQNGDGTNDDEGGGGTAGSSRGGSAGTSLGGDAGSTAARGGSGATGATASGGSDPFGRGGTGNVDPVEPPGPSFCGGEPCDPPLSCCLATGECYDHAVAGARGCPITPPDDDPQGRRPCGSSAQCEPNEFCMMDGPLCVGTGHCQPINNCGECWSDPSVPENPCRLCGCDGNTYPDIQTACRAGVNAVVSGAGCGETKMEGGAGASSIPPRTFTACGHDAHCPDGTFCCTLTSRCYAEADRDVCILPPSGTRTACRTNEHCGDREYCTGEGCDAPGGCVSMGSGPGDCGVTLEPVCGCDGVSYTSAACADQEGVRVDHEGECD